MGSQLDMQATYVNTNLNGYTDPAVRDGNPASYCLPTEPRPSKRIRLATRKLTSLATHLSPSSRRHATKSAHFPVDEHVQPEGPPPRSASVPPEPRRRGRKKKTKHNPQADPFILEHMPFPEHQPWLKVKPRQRKAAVEVTEEAPVLPPASQAPNDGEALVLDKHADRIAALIAQKRRENDSKHFRQRMALQQRLHRGEVDGKDILIAAGHDELKRKMELSAQGIYEENPPDGTEMEFSLAQRQSNAEFYESEGDAVSFVDVRRRTIPSFSGGLNISFDEPSTEVSESSDFDESYDDAEPVNISRPQIEPPPILGAYVHSSHTTYFRHSTMVTGAISHPVAIPQQANQSIYAAPTHSDHWAAPQPWTTQMFQALPSTQTPELERAEMARGRQCVDIYDTRQREASVRGSYSYMNDAYDFYGSASHSTTNTSSESSTPAAEMSHMYLSQPLHNQGTGLATNVTNTYEPETSAPNSNMNMFTRQARENGVIGGNNNVVPAAATRRNMFDNRN